MKKQSSLFFKTIGAALIALSTISCNAHSDSIYKNGARTHYEAIDLSSPESAAQTFISAWRSKDYDTFYFLLSPDAQLKFMSAFHLFDFSIIFPEIEKNLDFNDFLDLIEANLPENDFRDSVHNKNTIVDAILRTAEQHQLLPFTLNANARVKDINKQNQEARVTILTGTDSPAEITLVLKQMEKSKRWRITKFEIPGFETKSKLW